MQSPPLLFLLLLKLCSAHKDGAPSKACLTMTPGHDNMTPQPLDTALHKLEFAPAPSLKGMANDTSPQIIVATLTAKSTAPFKGFFVQARSTTSGDVNPVGMWDISGAAGLAKGVHCGGVKNSAVTHVDSSLKPSVTLLWSPPDKLTGRVVFVATVVQDFKTFWVGIQSEVLTLTPAASAGDASSSSSSGGSSSSTPYGSFSSLMNASSDDLARYTGGSSMGGLTSPSPSSPSGPRKSTDMHPLGSANANNHDSQQQQHGSSRGAGSHAGGAHGKAAGNTNDTATPPHSKKGGKASAGARSLELGASGWGLIGLLLLASWLLLLPTRTAIFL